MADQDDKVTGTPLVSAEDIANAADGETTTLPTNEEVLEQQDEDDKGGDAAAADGDAAGTPDDSGADDAPAAKADDEEPEAFEAVSLEDPGEFVAGDYSFELTTYDEEGKNGKSVKITSVEQWDELLEKEPNLGSSAAVAKAFRAASRMENGIERDERDWQAAKKQYEDQVGVETARTETITQWQSELDYLVGRGDLPPMAKDLRSANWSDPEVAKQPAVKAQIELMTYMDKENAARTKAGLKPMTSVLDAYNGFAREQEKAAAVVGRKNAAVARREAGAKVAGTAPAPVTTAPSGVAVGRVGVLGP